METVRLAPLPPKTRLLVGMRPVSLELPLTSKLPAAVSTSEIVKLTTFVTSSSVSWLAMAPITGRSFTGVIFKVKLLLAAPPSLSRTTTVIRTEPFWLVAG